MRGISPRDAPKSAPPTPPSPRLGDPPLAPALGGYVPNSVFPVERRAEAQASYGATIVSFLGGMHWGFAGAGFARAGAVAGAGASAAA